MAKNSNKKYQVGYRIGFRNNVTIQASQLVWYQKESQIEFQLKCPMLTRGMPDIISTLSGIFKLQHCLWKQVLSFCFGGRRCALPVFFVQVTFAIHFSASEYIYIYTHTHKYVCVFACSIACEWGGRCALPQFPLPLLYSSHTCITFLCMCVYIYIYSYCYCCYYYYYCYYYYCYYYCYYCYYYYYYYYYY